MPWNLDDNWQAWVDACREHDSTREGFDPDESACQTVMVARGVGEEKTIRQALVELSQGGDSGNLMALRWSIMNMWEEMSNELQDEFLFSVTNNPQACAAIYQTHERMTSRQYSILWVAFRDVMTVVASRFEKDPKHG